MKKKIKAIVIVLIFVVSILTIALVIKHKVYNNIEEDWEIKIIPIYAKQPSNTVFLYEDSYIITNSFTTNKWQNIVHKRGKLTSKLNQDLITKIEEEASEEIEEKYYFYKVILKNGKELFITGNPEVIIEIEKMINYDGTIWYATIGS